MKVPDHIPPAGFERLADSCWKTGIPYPTAMGWPAENINDNYGGRFSGYVVPPTTGSYIFAIRSDDASVLYLSTDDQATNRVQITSETGCCESFDAHFSSPINLV